MMRPSTVVLLGCCFAVPSFAAGREDPLLDELLFAGGVSSYAELRQLEAEFHDRVDPIVREVRGQPETIAAQLLLRHLHQDHQATQAPLKKYEIDAFSLNRVLTDGHYNCLSSTILFVLAARQAGLHVKAEFYDDHARAVLIASNGREYQVEATAADGVDAERWVIHTGLYDGVPLTFGVIGLEFPHDVSDEQLVAQIKDEAKLYGDDAKSPANMVASHFTVSLR